MSAPNGPKRKRRKLGSNVPGVVANSLWVVGTIAQTGGATIEIKGAVVSATNELPCTAEPWFDAQIGPAVRAVGFGEAAVVSGGSRYADVVGVRAVDYETLELQLSVALPSVSGVDLVIKNFAPGFAMPNGMQCAGCSVQFDAM